MAGLLVPRRRPMPREAVVSGGRVVLGVSGVSAAIGVAIVPVAMTAIQVVPQSYARFQPRFQLWARATTRRASSYPRSTSNWDRAVAIAGVPAAVPAIAYEPPGTTYRL